MDGDQALAACGGDDRGPAGDDSIHANGAEPAHTGAVGADAAGQFQVDDDRFAALMGRGDERADVEDIAAQEEDKRNLRTDGGTDIVLRFGCCGNGMPVDELEKARDFFSVLGHFLEPLDKWCGKKYDIVYRNENDNTTRDGV